MTDTEQGAVFSAEGSIGERITDFIKQALGKVLF
jgi:hypothetical protein